MHNMVENDKYDKFFRFMAVLKVQKARLWWLHLWLTETLTHHALPPRRWYTHSPDVANKSSRNPPSLHACVCLRVDSCERPTFRVHLPRFMTPVFPTTESASSFEIPAEQQIRDQREKQVLQPKTGDSHSGFTRLKKRGRDEGGSGKSLDTIVFI